MTERVEYAEGIEPRLRKYYTLRYGEAYWKENRKELLAKVLDRTGSWRPRTAKYTSAERRSMRRNPWEYPQWVLEDAQIPESYWRRYFDPEALAPLWQFLAGLIGLA